MLDGVVAIVWVADEVCAVVAEYIWWITGTLVLCFVLAVAASVALEAWADRRGAGFAARHGILSRTNVVLSESVAGSIPPVHLAPGSAPGLA